MQAYDLFFACLRIMEREAWLIKESRVLTFPFGRLRMAPFPFGRLRMAPLGLALTRSTERGIAGPELTESTERGMCRVSRIL